MATVYRVQPQGAELHAVRSETSNGDLANGVHVFTNLGQVAVACPWWCDRSDIELAEIECEAADIRPNGDYEGELLLAGRGRIVRRRHFRDTRRVGRWAEIQNRKTY